MITDTLDMIQNAINPGLNPCKCGSTNLEPKHIKDPDRGFCIWIVCNDCGLTSHSCTSFLDAVRNWNKKDYIK